MTDLEPAPQPRVLAIEQSLRDGLEKYLQARRERLPQFIETSMNFKSCVKVQTRHFLKDLALNPLNTLWAIPYLTIRKALEAGEKLGWEGANLALPTIPRSARTDFQKEMERQILHELFGLTDEASASEFAKSMEQDERLHRFYESSQWRDLKSQSEHEIKKMVTEYCNAQNGFNDLASSGGILIAAQYFFGDRSLDIFAMGRRWAALWSRQNAVTHFPLGHKLGKFFYKVAPAPPPTTHQVFVATAMALAMLALFSTVVNIFGFPARSVLGFQKPQMEKLFQSIEDKLLLRFSKSKIG